MLATKTSSASPIRIPETRPAEARAECAPAPVERVQPAVLPSWQQPSLDSLREQSLSRVEFSFESEESTPAWKRVAGTLLIVALLGGAGWAGYLLGWWGGGTAPTAAGIASAPVASSPADAGEKKNEPGADVPAASSATPAAAEEKNKTEQAAATPTAAVAASGSRPQEKVAAERPLASDVKDAAVTTPAPTVHMKSAEVPVVASPAATVAGSDVEEQFRKGEAFLYGRGVPENCEEAVKFLKSAADKSHAKARAAFGVMYATGHCAPRDLPTSYRWFAKALTVDPNNPILEKDLSAIWNQMTPPERQLATKNQ